MFTSARAYNNLSADERSSVDKFLPTWQRYLLNVYEFVFEPINKILAYFERSSTQHMIAEFDRRNPQA
jgi:hypothetical protein